MYGRTAFFSLLLVSHAASWVMTPNQTAHVARVPNRGPFDAGWGYHVLPSPLQEFPGTYFRTGIPDGEMRKNYLGAVANGLPENATTDEVHLFEVYLPSQALPMDWRRNDTMPLAHELAASAYQNPGPQICLSHLCAMVAGHKTMGSTHQGPAMFDADFFYFNPHAGDISSNPHSGVARGVFQWSWFKNHGAYLVYRGRSPGPWAFPSFSNMTLDEWTMRDAGLSPGQSMIPYVGAFQSFQYAFGFTLEKGWNGMTAATWSSLGVTNYTTINECISKLRTGGSAAIEHAWKIQQQMWFGQPNNTQTRVKRTTRHYKIPRSWHGLKRRGFH